MTHFEFSAGPACLPASVLKEAQEHMIDFHGSGRSIMEMSHRGAIVGKMADELEADLRELLNVPDSHAVLFMQGGGTGQFSCVPLNLCGNDASVSADFCLTGTWANKAIAEAEKYLTVNTVFDSKASTGSYRSIPAETEWKLSADADFVFYCDNETVNGVEWASPPTVGDKVLVADMSSNFLSRPVDVSKFGLIFAGAQKNCGIAGVTIVIVRKDLLGKHRKDTPVSMVYEIAEKKKSMYNTPPVWAMYMAGLVFKWVKSEGGVSSMAELAKVRSELLYKTIDESDGFYVAPVEKSVRSRINIVFNINGGDAELEKKFVEEAEAKNLHSLKGHRSVGGLRASLYNAMPLSGAEALVSFMTEFRAKHSKK